MTSRVLVKLQLASAQWATSKAYVDDKYDLPHATDVTEASWADTAHCIESHASFTDVVMHGRKSYMIVSTSAVLKPGIV